MQLKEEVQCCNAEKDLLLTESTKSNLDNMQEKETLETSIVCLTKERDQLLEVLQGLREEKSQLKEDLDKKDELVRDCQHL